MKKIYVIILSIVLFLVFIILGLLSLQGKIIIPKTEPMDYIVVGVTALFLPYGIYYNIETRRIKKIEERLPDFLRDVAEAGRFGMTLSDSILVASTGKYGALTDEIKKIAAQIRLNVPVNDALESFKERVKSPLVERMVTIIIKANEAGGNVADVLNMVSHAALETQLVEKERSIEMQTYVFVMLIAFGVFLATILILSASFFPEMYQAGKAVSSIGAGTAGAVAIHYQLIPQVEFLFVVATLINGFGDGILAGVLSQGKYEAGYMLGTVLMLSGYIFLRALGIA